MLNVHVKSFSYSETEILNSVSFDLNNGEHLFVLGESGCGKSTLLHLVYGLLDLEYGSISWKNEPILGPKYNLVPGAEFIKLVAQEYNVMPFTSVLENVTEHLSRRDLDADRKRAMELLEVVDMVPYADTLVKKLSGGQKQRVALAKALAREPELLLLDEPFSHIDTFRKNKLRRRLYRFLKQKGISCITATHDPAEALAFSDSLLILNSDGRMEALGSPESIYHSKNSKYVAGFFDEVSLVGDSIYYPHELELSKKGEFIARIVSCYFRGNHYLIEATSESGMLFFNSNSKLQEGQKIRLTPKS